MIRVIALSLACASPTAADTLVAAHTIRAQTVLAPSDLAMAPGDRPGALTDPDQAIGQEARVTLYAGRPIRAGDLGAPAIVERNQIVNLIYSNGAITILAEARALDRAGVGDRLRAMNLSSRSIVSAVVQPDGQLLVTGAFQ